MPQTTVWYYPIPFNIVFAFLCTDSGNGKVAFAFESINTVYCVPIPQGAGITCSILIWGI